MNKLLDKLEIFIVIMRSSFFFWCLVLIADFRIMSRPATILLLLTLRSLVSKCHKR